MSGAALATIITGALALVGTVVGIVANLSGTKQKDEIEAKKVDKEELVAAVGAWRDFAEALKDRAAQLAEQIAALEARITALEEDKRALMREQARLLTEHQAEKLALNDKIRVLTRGLAAAKRGDQHHDD